MQSNVDEPGLERVLWRNAFYQDNYYTICLVAIILACANIFLIFAMAYKWMHPTQPVYFAITSDGRIIMPYALSDPVVSDSFVLQWASDAVRKAFSLDYLHWREQLQDASVNFTPEGWTWFKKSLTDTNNLDTLVQLKMVSNIQLTAAPQIMNKQIVSGHYAWKISMPVLLTYTGQRTINQVMNVTLIVVRMPAADYPDRIALNNFLAQPAGS